MEEKQRDNVNDDKSSKPTGDAVYGQEHDTSAGGADSSAWENLPSGEKQLAAREPQNAPTKRTPHSGG